MEVEVKRKSRFIGEKPNRKLEYLGMVLSSPILLGFADSTKMAGK
jgi:hypothetical protein